MKPTKLWLATIATLWCSLTASAHDFSVGGIYYYITSSADLTVKVTYRGNYYDSYSNEYSGAVTIPSTVTYNSKTYSVTSIGNDAFYKCSSLTSITIPESVTSIGGNAFYGCSSLTSITIPESVTSIEGSALYGAAWYNNLPDGVVYAGKVLYKYKGTMPANTSIAVKEGTVSIGEMAFWGCSSLTSINIPESVTSIGDYAFCGCSSLTSINIPESVTSIGAQAFEGCSGELTVNCNIPSASRYEYGAFYNSDLTTVIIGESVTSIGDFAFFGCSSLTAITIPESVTSIGDYAFFDCSSLYSVTVGSGVLSIGSDAFRTPKKVIWLTNTPPTGYTNANGSINYVANDQYTSLNNVRVYPYLSSMFEVDGVKYVPVSPSERTCHAIDCTYDKSVATINVGETASFKGVAMKVTEVMPYTFYSNDHIKEVAVSHLGDIGDYAFYDCDAIETVDVSNQGGIGVQAFYNCDAIETVDVSNQGNIGNQAFYDCNGIKSVDIRNQGSIGNQAFYGCNGMEAAIVASYIPTSPSVDNTPLTFAGWTSTNHSHSSTSSETYTFTAGEGATLSFSWSVSSEASFDELIVTLDGTTILEKSGIQSGTYSNAISKGSHTLEVKYTKDSGDSSGSDQASVSNIAVAKGGATTLIAEVGSEAFSGCSSLKTVTLGDSIGSLGDEAFYQCSSLQEIVIPDSVKSVGSYCFSGCSAMKSAVIGDGVGNVQGYTFENCTALTDVTVGDGVTTISNYAFTGCSALIHVELGSSVATINNYAFRNCSSLPEITLPQAVTKVDDYVFAGCSKLADVVIADRTTTLALGSNGSSPLFVDCPLDSVYIGGKISYSTTSSYGYSPFYRNTSLRTVVITDREEQIYGNEFYGCTSLKNVAIGNGVKSIGNYAFSGCSGLDKFAFGSSMETIGEEAFSDCTNMTEICSSAMNPPTCGTQALDDINKWNCILKVPTGNMTAYQAAEQWKEFFFIEDMVEVGHYVLTYMVDGEVYHTETLKHKDEVTMLAEPTKVGYVFSGWDKTLTTMPAEDVVISGTFTLQKEFVILDTEASFVVEEDIELESITYTRNFKNTNWQALYVPFEIPVTEEFLADFEVADLNDVRQYDRNDDGVKDETVIEAFKVTTGTLEANYPYLIRAREVGEKAITVTDATLYATEENSIDCSSIREKFTFAGTYSRLSSEALPQGEGFYALSGGIWKPVAENASLGAFRFYLKVDSRGGVNDVQGDAIRMRIIGENGEEDDATGLDNSRLAIGNSRPNIIYDLQGRRVDNPTKGVYIVNGVKHVF